MIIIENRFVSKNYNKTNQSNITCYYNILRRDFIGGGCFPVNAYENNKIENTLNSIIAVSFFQETINKSNKTVELYYFT